MKTSTRASAGFSLIEVLIALGVLTVGMLGAAAVFATGMQLMTSAPGDLTATQKANEAIESVYSARDSHVLTWNQIMNVQGASGHDGGVFLDGPQPLYLPGPDGLINTADDVHTIETITYPGKDQMLGTGDDTTIVLSTFTREIQIRDVEANLRSITVIVKYKAGTLNRVYTLTAYISNFS